MARRRFCLRWLLVSLVAVAVLLNGAPRASRAAEIEGNTWTSETFGVSVTWDDTWFVTGEETGPWDLVSLTNGLTLATFLAVSDPALTAEAALASWIFTVQGDPTISEFTPMVDEAGNTFRGTNGERAFAAYSFVQTFEDGSTISLAAYLEAWLIVPGDSSMNFMGVTRLPTFESQLPLMRELTGFGEQPAPGPDEIAEGEPGPVFVSGQWRINIAMSILNEELPEIGLQERAGSEWLVLVADVTNWSEDEAEIPLRDFRLTGEGIDKPLRAAPSSTRSVAEHLGLEALTDELTLEVAGGETTRVALIYLVPDGSRAVRLALESSVLPLSDTLQSSIDPGELPAIAGPPEMIEGQIVSASDGRTIRVEISGESEPQRFRLLGVKPPAEGDCHEHDAEVLLDELVGTTVLIEADAGVNESSTPLRYVWIANDDQGYQLLNHRLIAEGRAEAASLPADARFGLWLEETERLAEAEAIGLWGGCDEESDADDESADTTSPPRQPAATATATVVNIWVDSDSEEDEP